MKLVNKDVIKFIDSWLSIQYKVNDLPGISIGLVENGKSIFAKGYGYANISNKQPNTEKTLFRIASISKVFAAIAILQLEEKDKLRISDPVSKYLPNFKSSIDKRISKITIKQLLTHTGKVTRDGTGNPWDSDIYPNNDELFYELNNPIHFPKSKHKFKYSNYGYSIIGLVIEQASGLSFEEYIQKNIMKPLGMTDTTSLINTKVIKKLATGYSIKEFPEFKRTTFKHPHTNSMAAATGLSSNIVDLNKFSIAIMRKSHKLLQNKGWTKAYSKQWLYMKEVRNMIMFGKPAGKHTLWGHGGGFQGFTTMMSLDLKNDLAVTIMINQIKAPSFGYAKAIHKIIVDWQKIIKKTSKFKNHPSNLKQYEGLYKGRWGMEAVIPVGKNIVIVYPTAMSPVEGIRLLEYKENDTFIVHDSDPYDDDQEFIKFIKGKNGKYIGFNSGGSSKTKLDI